MTFQLIGPLSEHLAIKLSYSCESEETELQTCKRCWWVYVQFCVISSDVNSFIVSSFVFFFPSTALVSVIFETCGFLFSQNILRVWHVCSNQRVHATCCTSLLRRTGFFSSPHRALEAGEDHQRCQLQTQINYYLEDDPVRLTSVPLFLFVCIYFQVLFHISSHALKRA